MSSQRSTRRRFNQQVATAAAAAVALPLMADAAQEPLKVQPAEALTNLLRARFGAHLSPEQWRQVQQRVQSNLTSAETLRRRPLQNSDEPDFIFQAELPS